MANVESSYKGCWWSLLLGVAVMLLVVMMEYYKPEVEPTVVIEHDTVWRDTTIYQPVAAETIQTGRVVYVKVAVPQPHTQRDTVHDSIEVPVPIVQKRYDDSLYTAWVSGFEPNLDSIQLHQPEIITTITETIVKPSPLITFGIQAGAGYGVINKKPDFYIGVGGQVNLWRK